MKAPAAIGYGGLCSEGTSRSRAISSAGERFVHTEEVTGSIPVSPTMLLQVTGGVHDSWTLHCPSGTHSVPTLRTALVKACCDRVEIVREQVAGGVQREDRPRVTEHRLHGFEVCPEVTRALHTGSRLGCVHRSTIRPLHDENSQS